MFGTFQVVNSGVGNIDQILSQILLCRNTNIPKRHKTSHNLLRLLFIHLLHSGGDKDDLIIGSIKLSNQRDKIFFSVHSPVEARVVKEDFFSIDEIEVELRINRIEFFVFGLEFFDELWDMFFISLSEKKRREEKKERKKEKKKKKKKKKKRKKKE